MWSKIQDFVYRILGKTQAFRLYYRLKHYASLHSTTICMLHKAEANTPCPKTVSFCGKESNYSVINFDSVKEYYCKQNKIKSLASVDAVMYKKTIFLFVEIKSWKNFERYQLRKSDSDVIRKKKIVDQTKKFKLKEKIVESMTICCEITKDQKLFNKMPVMYVLITDINTIQDPLTRFRARLGLLSYTSYNLLNCINATMNVLRTVGMNTRIVCCRQFDQFYKEL